jgi:REP element-mobilizing transposase RayT
MPFIKIWIHLVWSTKNRTPYLQGTDLRKKVWQHIKENAASKDIYLDCVNGYYDHVHCLMSLKTDQTIAKNVQLIKGEAAHWINKEKLIPQHFQWQSEYFAVSVSHSIIDNVRGYIHNQEQHHTKKTYAQEYSEFIEKHGFEKFKDLE